MNDNMTKWEPTVETLRNISISGLLELRDLVEYEITARRNEFKATSRSNVGDGHLTLVKE